MHILVADAYLFAVQQVGTFKVPFVGSVVCTHDIECHIIRSSLWNVCALIVSTLVLSFGGASLFCNRINIASSLKSDAEDCALCIVG